MRTGAAHVRMSPSNRSSRSPKMSGVEELVDVTGVELIGEYRLRLTFADGTVGDVDFSRHAWNGVFEPLRDPAFFAQVRVDAQAGTIGWPNGLDMAPERLYAEAASNPVPRAAASH